MTKRKNPILFMINDKSAPIPRQTDVMLSLSHPTVLFLNSFIIPCTTEGAGTRYLEQLGKQEADFQQNNKQDFQRERER